MFKIYDGRSELYQWDLNRKLIVADKSIAQVHFCNRTGECSLIRDVYEVNGMYLVDVPNILLQDNWDIKVYAWDSSYTKHSTVYNVVARTRPENYVYTETEQLKWEQLESRIDEIEENGISEESIRNAVEKYLDENGVEVDLTGYATETYVNEAIAAIEIPDNALLLEVYVTNAATSAEVQNIWSNGITKPVYFEKKPVIGYKKESSGSSRKLTLYVLTDNHTVTEYTASFASTDMDIVFQTTKSTVLATESYVQEQIAGIEHPTTDLTGYATEKYVDDAIANIDIPEGTTVDLSNYYTKTETETAINNAKPDLTGYALKTEIPDVSEYMGEQDVADYVEDELKSYATKHYVGTAIEEALEEFTPSTGEGGSAVEEVYVGTDAPTDKNIKLWINPDDVGITDVDGVSIVKDNAGVISTALGGGKEIVEEAVEAASYEDETGFTNADTNMRYTDGRSTNVFNSLDATVKYTVEMEFYNTETGETGSCTGSMWYANTNANYPWKFENVAVFDEVLTEAGYTSSQGNFFRCSGAYTQQYYITRYAFIKPAVYDYQKIDANYIPYGSGLQVTPQGELVTTLKGIKTIGTGAALIPEDLPYSNTVNSGIILGIGCNFTGFERSEGVVALGRNNKVKSSATVAIGDNCSADEAMATAIGKECRAKYRSLAIGYGVESHSQYTMAVGKCNTIDSSSAYNFIIGNGADANNRANGLTIDASGNVVTQGTISNAGADYAEYFEWVDGNPNAEDRVGYIVALEGNKIRLAKAGDDILGVVSGTATVLGDDAEWNWQGKYLRDEFGRLIMTEIEVYDENGEVNGTVMTPAINPEYDASKEYVSRGKRAEWDAIGMMGKLYVRDDGSCVVGGYATVAADGLASSSTGKSQMRVMERISDNIVRVLLK